MGNIVRTIETKWEINKKKVKMLRQVHTHALDTIVSEADAPMSDHRIHLKYDFFNFIGLQVDLPYCLHTRVSAWLNAFLWP